MYVVLSVVATYFYMWWKSSRPIKMILHCPKCQQQHVDAPEPGSPADYMNAKRWTNPPHRTHLCHACGNLWKPCLRNTEGVSEL